jgi:ABC-type branched-subunit amino acid transport system substrate-binding protein
VRGSRSWAGIAVIAVVVGLAGAACGGSSKNGGGGLGPTTTTSAIAGACKHATLTSPDVGVTASTITVTVMADVGSPLSPGLFQGSVDAVKAWAQYVNAGGGLACRQVVVKTVDSQLNADEAKNGIITACRNSLVLVGTTALFLDDMRPAQSCPDKTGAATGIPDLPALQTEPAEQCADISFSVVQQGTSCPYSGSGVRRYREATSEIAWFKAHVTTDLHGVFVLASDLPSTITASTPVFAAIEKNGVKLDKQFGVSALATQSQYTPVVAAIKAAKATWVISGLDSPGLVKLRKEAALQGVNTVKVWTCVQACYTPAFLTQAGPAAAGQYVYLSFLPFEDQGTNAMLDTFLKYDKKPDSFGVEAFASGLLFQKVVDDIVTKSGPNAITRSAIIAELRTVHAFDAGGLIATIDIANRQASPCTIVMHAQQGKWVQVDPAKKGTFDCNEPDGITELSLDPIKAYKPS